MSKSILAIPLFLFIQCNLVLSYSEDFHRHSTFHYDLTRVLAVGAGFTQEDAELIAIADQATDSTRFVGAGMEIEILGTERFTPRGNYWHFPRRSSTSTIADTNYPGNRNTCDYFAETQDTCSTPELESIESWADRGGKGTLSDEMSVPDVTIVRTESVTIDWTTGGGDARDQKLVALGIYLHSLADSYSHEACMKSVQLRSHTVDPAECNAKIWHRNKEFGHNPGDSGVAYTKEAAMAVWNMLKAFREKLRPSRSQILSDSDAETFINVFAETNRGVTRSRIATSQYSLLAE